MERKNYFPGVDLLRIVAMFGIVGCHLDLSAMTGTAIYVKRFTDYNVGVFAALAGFFFFVNQGTSFREYSHKRITRLLLPYLSWTVLYLLFTTMFHLYARGSFLLDFLHWPRCFEVLFWGASSAHLWFVISLFYAQIALYKFRVWSEKGWLFLMLSLTFIYVANGEHNWYCCYPVRLLGFFFLGGWLRMLTSRLTSARWLMPVALLVFVCGAVITSFCDRNLYFRELILALPLCVLAIRMGRNWSNHVVCHLRIFGELTFVVYLIHLFFTIALREVFMRCFQTQNAVVFLVDQLLAFVLSFLAAVGLSACAKKYKWLNIILGIQVGKV